ncbi:MAG: hypothetical protein B6229_04140 [Spirochaetaceae bacterium 4572_7]|nr:MAG: hypothetical protein B6229_04140 [Spirochaetaceae bacterium 4572_7]
MRKIILLIIIFITFSFSAFSTTNINYEKTKIKLIVFGPGDEIFTRWGHFGIVIDYPEKKDLLFDYGNFSFKENDFLKNFIKGIMKYSKEVAYADYVIRAYKRVNRSITTAELDLTPEQKKLFIDTLFFEIEPENKYYQYDQFKNNCVSEMNRLINEVTDGTFLKDTSDSTNRTFRETTRDYISSNHFYNLLIMLLLGTQMDRDITIEESLFLPDLLNH